MNADAENLLERIRKEVPDSTGIYLFYGPSGELLYIGKSIHLKQRMSSYFQNDTSKLESRIRTLIFNIRSFEWKETGSELGALLLEDQWIKERLPPYNRKQKKFTLCQYLALTNDSFPTLLRMDPIEKDIYPEYRWFGPFRDSYFVDKLLEITCKHLHLRACRDPEPLKRCPQFDMGFCKGPCRDAISIDDYQRIVDRVIAFLEGSEEDAMPRLNRAMEARSQRLDYEGAAQAKELLQFAERFCKRQSFIHRFKTEDLVVCESDRGGSTHLFSRGRYRMERGELSREEARSMLSEMKEEKDAKPEDERFLLDRANLVMSWLNAHEDRCSLDFIG